MRAVLFLLPIVIALGAIFGWLFFAAVRTGQFDDLDDPPVRILHEDDE